MGFVLDDTSYLKDGWNILDFAVVMIGLVSLVPGVGANGGAVRVIRVLRPLRSLGVLPGMRVLVGTILKSIPMISNVLILSIFMLLVFGIFGMQVRGITHLCSRSSTAPPRCRCCP